MGHKQHQHDHNVTHRHGPENGLAAAQEPGLEDRIRRRAYELFQAHPDSSELQDWLCAEREILQASPAPPAVH